jgi:hypothetical protein
MNADISFFCGARWRPASADLFHAISTVCVFYLARKAKGSYFRWMKPAPAALFAWPEKGSHDLILSSGEADLKSADWPSSRAFTQHEVPFRPTACSDTHVLALFIEYSIEA